MSCWFIKNSLIFKEIRKANTGSRTFHCVHCGWKTGSRPRTVPFASRKSQDWVPESVGRMPLWDEAVSVNSVWLKGKPVAALFFLGGKQWALPGNDWPTKHPRFFCASFGSQVPNAHWPWASPLSGDLMSARVGCLPVKCTTQGCEGSTGTWHQNCFVSQQLFQPMAPFIDKTAHLCSARIGTLVTKEG